MLLVECEAAIDPVERLRGLGKVRLQPGDH
jgi:hypothetical protein